MTLTTRPSPLWSSSTRTTSFDLRGEPSPRAIGTAAGVDRAFAVARTEAEPDRFSPLGTTASLRL